MSDAPNNEPNQTNDPTSAPESQPSAAQPAAAQTPAAQAPAAQTPAAPVPAAPATPAPQTETRKKSGVVNPYIWGTGRRKASVARVRVKPGNGTYMINNREVDDFFRLDKDRLSVREPLMVANAEKLFDVFVNVKGGGTTGQSGAVVLGLARALAKANPDFEAKLREKHLLSRDSRRVERKKYGKPGARRSFQFSKR